MPSHAPWLEPTFCPSDREETITNLILAISAMEQIHGRLNLVGRGLSGTLLGYCVARDMRRTFMVVRCRPQKFGIDGNLEYGCHSDHAVENAQPGKYVIIDDFVDSGHTVRTTVDTISKESIKENDQDTTVCVGVLLYGSNAYRVAKVPTTKRQDNCWDNDGPGIQTYSVNFVLTSTDEAQTFMRAQAPVFPVNFNMW